MAIGDGDARIVSAWRENAAPWTAAVRSGAITSRRDVTDAAVVDAVLGALGPMKRARPKIVLDVGCGEGWLCRRLASAGVYTVGIDTVAALIEAARSAHADGDYRQLDYASLPTASLGQPFDAVVCNFSLLGEHATEAAVAAVAGLLAPMGTMVVQTLYPPALRSGPDYVDGWVEGTWAGIKGAFGAPAPWFFRTISGWHELFIRHGLVLVDERLTQESGGETPASLLFLLSPKER